MPGPGDFATNVLLINSNVSRCARSGYGPVPPPAGLISLGGVLRDRGHAVRICQVHSQGAAQDEASLPLVRAELEALLEGFSPDAVGVSVRNIGAARRPADPFHLVEYYAAFYDARVVRALRMITSAPVVMGGTAFSLEPRLYLKVAQPGYGLLGEAEETLPALLDALAAGAEPSGIPGLVRSVGDVSLAAAVPGLVGDLAAIGVGACDLVEDFRGLYYAEGGLAPILTKRGCAMNCVYCTTPFFEGRTYRYRPMNHVLDEMRAYRRAWGVRHFFFVDSTFNHPLDHAKEVCEALLASGLDAQWYTELTPACLDDELCRLMVRSGCIGVTLGLDSCSERVLLSYGKPFGLAEIRHAMALLRAHGIPFDATVILGGPGDTEETFGETLAFCTEHLGDTVVRFFDGMIVTAGSPVFGVAAREGVIDPAVPYDELVLANDFRGVKRYEYCFPHAGPGRRALIERVARACRQPRWLVTSRDYPPDPRTGELSLHPDIHVERGARPWWRGLHRKTASEEAHATVS